MPPDPESCGWRDFDTTDYVLVGRRLDFHRLLEQQMKQLSAVESPFKIIRRADCSFRSQ